MKEGFNVQAIQRGLNEPLNQVVVVCPQIKQVPVVQLSMVALHLPDVLPHVIFQYGNLAH